MTRTPFMDCTPEAGRSPDGSGSHASHGAAGASPPSVSIPNADMRLLVCGGRDFDDVPWLWAVLDEINQRRIQAFGDGIRCLIDGGQKKKLKDGRIVGADYWAHQWALARNTPTERFFADWNGLGRAAGPIRNQRQIDEGKPTHCLAAPGGYGTADMVGRAKRAGIPVREMRR